MATLVSPGVSVTVTDESVYASSAAGTVPLVVIATAANKLQPGSTTAIASGTIPANAGTLYQVTSQRDALQTFGTPTYYSSGGTAQYANELNEHGLYALYQYLGIANTAYVLRANIDLAQLIPSSTAPTGTASAGSYWLDTSQTTYGMFRSNGNTNSALAWSSVAPTVITSAQNLETIIQGNLPSGSLITDSNASAISVGGSLVVNGIVVSVTTSDSLNTIANKINSNSQLSAAKITATVFTRVGKTSSSTYGDIYNLRIVAAGTATSLDLTGTTTSVLTDLGFLDQNSDPTPLPTNNVAPAGGFGTDGGYAIDTVSIDTGDTAQKNRIWQKISVVSTYSTKSWWFRVGSTDTTYPGWGWTEANPTVITGKVSNPVFVHNDSFTITVDVVTADVVVPSDTSLAALVATINTAISSTAAIASIYTVGGNKYLRIVNYSGTSIYLKDNDDQTATHHPLRTAGIFATQTYFGSVTGTVANPSYVGAILKTASASVVAAGSGYSNGDALTVVGGTGTASVLQVSAVSAVANDLGGSANAGSGYAVNDTLTFSGAGFTRPVVMTVQAISGGAITNLAITDPGQFTGSMPSNPVTPTSTSGSGINATVNITWGVSTVTVSVPGSYTVAPTSPVAVTGGGGSAATFTLTPGFVSSNMFTIDAGAGPVAVHVPASPNNTVAGVAAAINTAFASGPIVASVASGFLTIKNTNGTNFTIQDVSGNPLATSGIPVGYTYGEVLTYQGYSPSLTVPNSLSSLAAGSVWINTTPADRGSNYVLKQFNNSSWVRLNTTPNTGTVPMYTSDAAADSGFGASKAVGSIYLRYNSEGTTPASASQQFFKWTDNNGTFSWDQLSYTASNVAPVGTPPAGTLWFNSALQADIMVCTGEQWKGYRNVYPGTDPNGIIISGTAPTTQSNNNSLVDYDMWLDSSNAAYPSLYRYTSSSSSWTLIDNTDHSSPAGIIFADARPNTDGTATGSTTQAAMVLSDYVDSDAPNAELYPAGMLLFNTRYSTNNVKVWSPGYLVGASYPDRWVTASGNKPDGTPYMGASAQRAMVVRAMQAVVESSQEARAEDRNFNLIAAPGYVEMLTALQNLNTDKKNAAFIIGDTPGSLPANGTAIQNWATNAADVPEDGPLGLVTADPYIALYYPWALATNLDGTNIFVPPSTMALTTYAYNDQVAYPWFAPAGFNRGIVTGALSVGYLNASGNYVPVTLNQGQRDVLYTNNINPIAYIPNRGLVIYGQKTLNPVSSAMDRVNVARLVNYLNFNLDNLGKPFLFEPNDKQTRSAVSIAFNAFMNSLVGLRALYDFAVVCDSTNNTPDRIDRNELWIDLAIQPEKSIEFIYIPIRILNTGAPLPGATQTGSGNNFTAG